MHPQSLYSRKYVFVPKYTGAGLGIRKPSGVYYAKKVSSYLQMLNYDGLVVLATAEKSLKLHMQKLKVKETEQEYNFARYEINENGVVDKNVRMCLSKSSWIELNDICSRLGIYFIKLDNN